MRPLYLLPVLIPLALGFSDTSPYLLISSSSIPSSARTHHILSTSTFTTLAASELGKCTSDAYIIVSQPGLHIEDLTRTRHAGVHLKDLLAGVGEDRRWLVENVYVDSEDADMGAVLERLQEVVTRECGAVLKGVDAKTGSLEIAIDEGKKPKVLRVDFDALPSNEAQRQKKVEMHDAFLHSVLEMVGAARYSLVFTSSPIGAVREKKDAGVQKAGGKPALELRSVVSEEEGKNQTMNEGGLFHRYQFFTPAIFMGYIAFTVMILILYVALSAVSSIKVSYGAFEKEMGPVTHKKQL